jgi:predicted AAA+ superfamily ATPase
MPPEYPRELSADLSVAAKQWPAVVLTGPRRAGKTWLLKKLLPRATYVQLEDPDVLSRAKSDPRSFLDELPTPVVLDEVQNAPELLRYVRSRIDAEPRAVGRWFLTGSQDFALMHGVTESLAGRAAVFHLLPLSFRETGTLDLLRGGYPEIRADGRAPAVWFRSYVQTYLERDVRAVTAVKDLAVFRRFLALAAARNAQMVNYAELAAALGVSGPTVKQWIDVLATTGVVQLVPPYFENFEKRLVKTPKLYWLDTGLLCHLLGATSVAELERSGRAGAVFETALASELLKNMLNAGRPRELYWFRDHQGFEVDFVLPTADGGLRCIEAKYTRTPRPDDARNVAALMTSAKRRDVEGFVVHRGGGSTPKSTALVPGVRALPIEAFLAL